VNSYQWRDFDIRSIWNLRHIQCQFELLEKWRGTCPSWWISHDEKKKKNGASIPLISCVSQKRYIQPVHKHSQTSLLVYLVCIKQTGT